MTAQRVQLRQLTLLAILTALSVVLRIAKLVPIPNVQPVSDILMIVTLELGVGFGIALTALTMFLSNIILGFGIWTIPQILAYIGCVLTIAFLAKILPLKKHLTLQIIVAVIIGFEYGFLVSLGMSIYGGVAAFVAYWLSGILFDFYHAAGNFAFYLVLYKPLTMALEKYEKRLL